MLNRQPIDFPEMRGGGLARIGRFLKRLWPFRRAKTDNSTGVARRGPKSGPHGESSVARGPGGAQILHLSLGPVQGFVAEARRTRDLWAGSFLLSWLTGHAIAGVENIGGEIVFPHVKEDELYRAIRCSTDASGNRLYPALEIDYEPPQPEFEPSLTNHFTARFDSHVEASDIKAVVRHVHSRWRMVAEAVWDRFLKPAFDTSALDEEQLAETRKIWNRQIGAADRPAFWEIAWVLGPAGTNDDHEWIERRKAWRTFDPEPEPDDMCRMMGTYQELSGQRGQKQRTFWITLRASIANTLGEGKDAELLELRETERLCAIAFVKRMFPRLHPDTLRDRIGWLPKSHEQHAKEYKARTGRDPDRLLVSYRSSTAFVAAAHWIARASRATSEAEAFRDTIKNESNVHRTLERAERHSGLPCHNACRELARTDGRLFYRSVLQTKRKEPGVKKPGVVLTKLDILTKASLTGVMRRPRIGSERSPDGVSPIIKVGEPSPYYALLRMDGDHVGKLIREDSERIKKPLAEFAGKARKSLKDNNGSVIYAGGDDLLAFLPIEDALPAAEELRNDYQRLIGTKAKFGARGTVSAAIVFAHYEASLGGALRRSRELLERLAKEENGRASLALAIHRTDGAGPEWVSTWDWITSDGAHPVALDMYKLARCGNSLVDTSSGKKIDPSTGNITSNRFVYGVGTRLKAFFDETIERHPETGVAGLPSGENLRRLLLAVGGADAPLVNDRHVTKDFDRLERLLKPQRRLPDGSHKARAASLLSLSGLLILSFLARQWRRIEKS